MSHAVNVGKLRFVEPRPTIRIATIEEEPDPDNLDNMERTVGAIEDMLRVLREAPKAEPGSRKRGRPNVQTERNMRAYLYRKVLRWTYREIGRTLKMGISVQAIDRACRSGGEHWRNLPPPLAARVAERIEAKLNPNRPVPAEPAVESRFARGRW